MTQSYSTENNVSRQRIYITLIIVVCLFAFFTGLNKRSLFSQDVVRYAEIAREMIHYDSWLIPKFNGEVYTNKPAPYIWLIAVPSLISGEVNELTARLPSALAGLGAVIFTYLLASRMYSQSVGLFSALSLVACYKFNLLARTSRTDMPFTFFVIAALYFFYSGIVMTSKRRRYYIAGSIMLAGSVLMKGPAGLAVILITLITYSITKHDKQIILNRYVLWGCLLFLFIVGIWLVPTCIVGGSEFAKDLIFRQNIGRFAGEIDHAEPFYYYFYKLPIEIAPLNLLLPLVIAFYFFVKNRQKHDIKFIFIYLVAAFAFLQLSISRNIRYLLPLYPAIAILAGIFWDDLINCRDEISKIAKGFFLGTTILILLLSIGLIFAMPVLSANKGISKPLFAIALSIMLAVALSRAIRIWKINRAVALLVCFVASSVIAYVFLVVQMDLLERVPKQVAFGKELKNYAGGDELFLYKYRRWDLGHTMPSEFFYFGKYTPAVDSWEHLRKILELNKNRTICILTLNSIYEHEFEDKESIEILLKQKYIGEEVVLARIYKE